MTNPTARAISTVAVSASCACIAFASPAFATLAVIGICSGVYVIWAGA